MARQSVAIGIRGESFRRTDTHGAMTTKTVTANGVNEREEKQLAELDGYLEEMASIRKRMKTADARIRRADAVIRQNLDQAWAILHPVQTGH